jgi:hypothetical protein
MRVAAAYTKRRANSNAREGVPGRAAADTIASMICSRLLTPASFANTCASLLLALAFNIAAASAQSAVKTGKERLGDKASDEQRVDNCKVPRERWGKTIRPAACAHDRRIEVTH